MPSWFLLNKSSCLNIPGALDLRTGNPHMKMRKINVGIADDHPVVLAGISRILKEESDIEVVL